MVRCSNNNPFVTCISCTLLLHSVRTLLNVTCQDIIKFFSVASEIGEVGPSFMVCFKEQPYSLPSPAHVEIMFFHFVKWMKIKRILKRMNCVQVGTTLEVKMEKTKRLQWKEGNENLVSKKKEKAVYQWYWKWKKLLLPRLHTILALGSGCLGSGRILMKNLSGMKLWESFLRSFCGSLLWLTAMLFMAINLQVWRIYFPLLQ